MRVLRRCAGTRGSDSSSRTSGSCRTSCCSGSGPAFIKCDALVIDESFHDAALHGTGKPYTFPLDLLTEGDRTIPQRLHADADLVAISTRVHAELEASRKAACPALRCGASTVTAPATPRRRSSLEWRRKLDLEVRTRHGRQGGEGRVRQGRRGITSIVARLARFWRLLKRTLEASDERSPWLELRHETDKDGKVKIVVAMAWRDEIHASWHVPTLVMDATMPVEIVRQFFPQMEEPVSAAAPMPHTRVRQITDRAMSAAMLIATRDGQRAAQPGAAQQRRAGAPLHRGARRRCAGPGACWSWASRGSKTALRAGALPETVEMRALQRHHRAERVERSRAADRRSAAPSRRRGRSSASPAPCSAPTSTRSRRTRRARCDYPRIVRGIRMRDGTGREVEGNQHPDPRAEAVRWSICEAELIQTIGRGRGVNRTAANPLQIDILTNVCLPIEVDEVDNLGRDPANPGLSRSWPPAARCRCSTAIWRRPTRTCSSTRRQPRTPCVRRETP